MRYSCGSEDENRRSGTEFPPIFQSTLNLGPESLSKAFLFSLCNPNPSLVFTTRVPRPSYSALFSNSLQVHASSLSLVSLLPITSTLHFPPPNHPCMCPYPSLHSRSKSEPTPSSLTMIEQRTPTHPPTSSQPPDPPRCFKSH